MRAGGKPVGRRPGHCAQCKRRSAAAVVHPGFLDGNGRRGGRPSPAAAWVLHTATLTLHAWACQPATSECNGTPAQWASGRPPARASPAESRVVQCRAA